MSSKMKLLVYGLLAGAAIIYLSFTIRQLSIPEGFFHEIGVYLGVMVICPTPLLVAGLVLLKKARTPEPSVVNPYIQSPGACQHCGQLREGYEYTIHYGKKLSEATYSGTRTTTFQISGSRTLYLCDDCVANHYTTFFGNMALMFLGIAFGSLILGAAIVVGFILAALMVPVFLYFLFFWVKGLFLRGKKLADRHAALQKGHGPEMGDELAKKIFKKDLVAAGYDSFFTRSEYKKLDINKVRQSL